MNRSKPQPILFAPASGEVLAINPAVQADPSLLNTDPLGAGWLFTVRLTAPAQLDALMDESRLPKRFAS